MMLELRLTLIVDDDLVHPRHQTIWAPWFGRSVRRLAVGVVEALDGRATVTDWHLFALHTACEHCNQSPLVEREELLALDADDD